MANPIWRDYQIDLGSGTSCLYRIGYNNTSSAWKTIYQGRAYKRPGDSTIKVNINGICADFLAQVATMPQADFLLISFPLTFQVHKEQTGGGWQSVTSVQFLPDWSYDSSYNPSTMGMSFPINGHIDSRQWIPASAYGTSNLSVRFINAQNVGVTETKTLSIADGFCNNTSSKDADIYRCMESAGNGTLVFNLANYNNVDRVLIGGIATYKVVTSCAKYALLYVNAYGGWDTFLIEGNTRETSTITRHTNERQTDNNALSANILNPTEVNFVNEVTKEFTFVTGWLSDDESSRMHHLLNSPKVYLYDIAANSKTPVILSTDTHEEKTYRGNGCQMVNYEITARVATNTIRR